MFEQILIVRFTQEKNNSFIGKYIFFFLTQNTKFFFFYFFLFFEKKKIQHKKRRGKEEKEKKYNNITLVITKITFYQLINRYDKYNSKFRATEQKHATTKKFNKNLKHGFFKLFFLNAFLKSMNILAPTIFNQPTVCF